MTSDTSNAIVKAVKRVEELSLDKDTRLEYEMRMKALSDYNSIIYDTKAEGIKEGKMKKAITIVIDLVIKTHMSLTDAMKLSHLDFFHKNEVREELNKKGRKYNK